MSILHEVLHLGPLDNNTYLLWCGKSGEAALVDVGFEPEQAVAEAKRRGVRLRYLLNTHAHYDHVAGMAAAQAELGGDYYLHPADRPLLARLREQGDMFGFPRAGPPAVIHDLADGQRLALGEESLEVIHTPGHSPGGVCFRSGGELWVGDTLFAGSVGRTDLPGGSFEQLLRSVRTRLFPLGDELRAWPGHGPETTLGEERLHNPFVGEGATWR
jgi:glyoxylase-like metal-dependent hydrolase (beta-lactamase superfamily II)